MLVAGADGKASAWATVFNLCNSAVGAGVLSFPMAFHLTGWIGGLILCPIVATIVLIPLFILANKASKHGSRTYQGLVRDTLGPAAATFVAWTVFIYICGACTAFMMICGSSFQALLQTFPIIYGPTEVPPRWVSILIPSTLIILPLSLLPSMAALAATSTLALAVYCFNIASVASEYIRSDVPIIPTHAEAYHWKLEAIKAIPIMIFAYQCHVQSVPIFAEMTPAASLFSCCSSTDADAERSQIAATAKRRRVLPVFMVAVAQCTVMYSVMGVTGYLLFPVNTQSNILNNFDIDNDIMFIVRMLVGFAVALHYPIDLHVARTAMYDLVCGCLGKVPVYPAPYISLAQCTVAIWGGSLVLACLVTDLGVVFQVLGGVACTLLIFILPGLMLLFDGVGNIHASVSDHNHARNSEQDNRGGEAPVDEVPLIPSSTGVCTSAPGDGTTQEEVRSPNNGDVGVRTEVDERGDAVVRLVDGVHEDVRWGGSGAAGNDCRTKVLGWSLVTFGSCIMLLTVYLTVFG